MSVTIDKFEYATDAAAQAAWPPPAGYFYDSNTKLMLHMDGTTTTFTDSSDSVHTITPHGDVTQTDGWA